MAKEEVEYEGGGNILILMMKRMLDMDYFVASKWQQKCVQYSPRFWVMLYEFLFSIVGFLFVVYIVRKISVGRGRLETR
jgi:prolipoprotein diacylglyceryltransferase